MVRIVRSVDIRVGFRNCNLIRNDGVVRVRESFKTVIDISGGSVHDNNALEVCRCLLRKRAPRHLNHRTKLVDFCTVALGRSGCGCQ